MNEWDVKYHRQKNLNLKTTLITLAVVTATFSGLTIAERIAFSITFPASSEYVEIDGILFSANIETANGWGMMGTSINIRGINLTANNNPYDLFPGGVNATGVWLIPTAGGIWSWKDYEIFTLRMDPYYSDAECAFYELGRDGAHISRNFPYFDAIVEVKAPGGNIYYISAESEYSILIY